MTFTRDDAAGAATGWRKPAVLVLAVAAVGVPINDAGAYALLLVVAVIVFTGEVSARLAAWAAALAIVAAAIAGQWWLSPPRIDEGHNVFLPGSALQRSLPPDVYKHMSDEFDAVYPPPVRCRPDSAGCWQGSEPERAFAFSADSVLHASDLSRAVTTLDFSDPVWLRLGFVNELAYNWYTTAPDVRRVDRDRRFYMGWRRWRFVVPWFELIRLPAAYVGGELCWRGNLLWEAAGGHFALWRGDSCRTIEAADAGRRVFGVAIKPGALAMRLTPPWRIRLLQYVQPALALAACIGLIVALVRVRARRTIIPFILIILAVAAIAADDASFLGGVRPFDGGDDGLFYDGVGRVILQRLLSGDIAGFLQGGENVFYYGGPGLRYFRALEHIVFGESYLGYLTLVLLLPFLVYGLLRRFLPGRWPLASAIIFTAIPVGALFGTTFFQYAQWAGRGFADPAAYILFAAGLFGLVRATEKFHVAFFAAFFAALLFALAIFMKPIVAPAAAVLLAGAGIWALSRQQWPRLAGLCIGFVPVFAMALHNWVFGHVFVLFSTNAGVSQVLVMPPTAWLAALYDGPQAARAAQQIVHWLSGPAQIAATIPVNAALIAVVIYVAVSRPFDPWLRLMAGAALAQHAVALFYIATIARYHFLAWFLTMVVALVWLQQVGMVWLQRRYPNFCLRIAAQPLSLWLASGLARLHKVSA
jgi:hypothetical protein